MKPQSHKVVKHTRAISRLLTTNCLSAFDYFVELGLKGLNILRQVFRTLPNILKAAKILTRIFKCISNFVITVSISRYATQAGIYLLKVNNRNTKTRCEICSKLTIKTPERRLIVNFGHLIAGWDSSQYERHDESQIQKRWKIVQIQFQIFVVNFKQIT